MSLIHEFAADDDRVLYDEVHCFSVYDQWWNKEAIQELWDKHNIIFMSSGRGCIPVKIIPRDGEAPLVALGVEDDGTLYFRMNSFGGYANSFDSSWIDSFIADLQEAKAKINGGAKEEVMPSRPQTNADRIRKMTVEELADIMQGQCACCAYQLTGCTEKECKDGAYEWLMKEESE